MDDSTGTLLCIKFKTAAYTEKLTPLGTLVRARGRIGDYEGIRQLVVQRLGKIF